MGGGVNVLGDFAGYGVWEYDPFRGWFKLTNAVAAALTVTRNRRGPPISTNPRPIPIRTCPTRS